MLLLLQNLGLAAQVAEGPPPPSGGGGGGGIGRHSRRDFERWLRGDERVRVVARIEITGPSVSLVAFVPRSRESVPDISRGFPRAAPATRRRPARASATVVVLPVSIALLARVSWRDAIEDDEELIELGVL